MADVQRIECSHCGKAKEPKQFLCVFKGNGRRWEWCISCAAKATRDLHLRLDGKYLVWLRSSAETWGISASQLVCRLVDACGPFHGPAFYEYPAPDEPEDETLQDARDAWTAEFKAKVARLGMPNTTRPPNSPVDDDGF